MATTYFPSGPSRATSFLLYAQLALSTLASTARPRVVDLARMSRRVKIAGAACRPHGLPSMMFPNRLPTREVRVRSLGPFNPAPKEADKNFVPIDQALNSEEDGPVGPLACLLVGFSEGDCVKFRRMMSELDADFVNIIAESNLEMTLEEALQDTARRTHGQELDSRRRLVMLSGMYPPEISEVMAGYDASELPVTVWAAAVPNAMNKSLAELMDEIYEDDSMMNSGAH
ncbi:hypothetical protein AAMO2058_000668600 [Amorphochlora amoebiformis]